jgi:hypothetical protein
MEVNSSAVERYTHATLSYQNLILLRMKSLFKIDDEGVKKSD